MFPTARENIRNTSHGQWGLIKCQFALFVVTETWWVSMNRSACLCIIDFCQANCVSAGFHLATFRLQMLFKHSALKSEWTWVALLSHYCPLQVTCCMHWLCKGHTHGHYTEECPKITNTALKYWDDLCLMEQRFKKKKKTQSNYNQSNWLSQISIICKESIDATFTSSDPNKASSSIS